MAEGQRTSCSKLVAELVPVIAGGVAHELANVFSALSAQLDSAVQAGEEPSATDNAVRAMRALIERGTNAISLLNSLLSPSLAGETRVSLPVARAVECIRLCSSSHVVRVEQDSGLLERCRCAGDALFALTFCLLMEGVEAAPNGGLIDLRISLDRDSSMLRCSLSLAASHGPDGSKGEGAALMECRQLAEAFGGCWREDHGEGKLALSFLLPVKMEHDHVKDEAPPPPLDGQGEVVYVVEDEEPVRSLMVKMLVKMGHLAFGAGSCAEAAAELKILGDTVSVLVIDIGLPDAKGPACYERLASFLGDVPVIYVSGATHPPESLYPDTALCLVKPLVPSTLEEAISIIQRRRKILSPL